MTQKPRIVLVWQVWECRMPDWLATGVIGFGYSPADAYREWVRCGGLRG